MENGDRLVAGVPLLVGDRRLSVFEVLNPPLAPQTNRRGNPGFCFNNGGILLIPSHRIMKRTWNRINYFETSDLLRQTGTATPRNAASYRLPTLWSRGSPCFSSHGSLFPLGAVVSRSYGCCMLPGRILRRAKEEAACEETSHQ